MKVMIKIPYYFHTPFQSSLKGSVETLLGIRFSLFKFYITMQCLLSIKLFSQNLVLNPSFEDIYKCPAVAYCSPNISSYNFNYFVKHWSAMYDSVDYILHSTCLPNGPIYVGGVPISVYGYSYPRTGNNYLFVVPRNQIVDPDISPVLRFYLVGKLASPLVKNQFYCVKYYVKRVPAKIRNVNDGQCIIPSGGATKVYDACLTDTIIIPNIQANIYQPLSNFGYHPQIKNKKFILDTLNWTEISGMFKAKGGEKYIILGDFQPISDEGNPNLYMVAQSNSGQSFGLFLDDVSVIPFNLQIPDLGKDTIICPNAFPYTLHAPSGYDSIIWSTGAINTLSINISHPGTYWVKCVASGCGVLYDTISIQSFTLQNLKVTNDTFLCKGHSIVLEASKGFNDYLWSNGSTSYSISVSVGGTYYVTASNLCQNITKSITVKEDSVPNIYINIGKDTNICVSDSFGTNINLPLTIYPNISNLPNYYWNNGNNSSYIIVNESGQYWLKVIYPCGSIYSNTINVTGCPPDKVTTLWVPNTFTPDNDGLNDEWQPIFLNKEILDLRIYNRWGECVFIGNSNNQYKWNGIYNNQECEQGIYAYFIEYTNAPPAPKSRTQVIYGHINLIRNNKN